MNYYSTNKDAPEVDFKEASIKGQAPDKGLYFPKSIPSVDKSVLDQKEKLSPAELGFRVIKPYVGSTIPDETLFQIVSETLNFPIPLVKVTDEIYSLELFHGPTLAFKDIGARFMSRCLGYFLAEEKRRVTVLVATSGDTGGAVAHGFFNVPGIDVIILYPSGKVSPVQEKQLTTLGKNIHALEVLGSFDDCQQMVKQAFADEELNKKFFLTSANSINVARWLPQQFYYFLALQEWNDAPPVISVPSGNFGNICAGILAMKSGLPVDHFIAACNVNDIVSGYLETASLTPKQSVPTLSNAMDVGNPSNFIRILEIFNHQFPELKSKLSAYTVDDLQTRSAMSRLWKQYHYMADPHGAVGYHALDKWLIDHPEKKGIFLETAHPVKFPESVEDTTGSPVPIPKSLSSLMTETKKSTLINPGFKELKDYLNDRG